MAQHFTHVEVKGGQAEHPHEHHEADHRIVDHPPDAAGFHGLVTEFQLPPLTLAGPNGDFHLGIIGIFAVHALPSVIVVAGGGQGPPVRSTQGQGEQIGVSFRHQV